MTVAAAVKGRRRVPWMVTFLAKRLAWAIVTLFLFLTAIFFFMQVWVPITWATRSGAGYEFGSGPAEDLNRPLIGRYLDFMTGLVGGDLGTSYGGLPVTDIIVETAPITIFVFAAGAVIAYVIGELLGRVVAWRRNRAAGAAMSTIGVVSTTIFPPFLVFLLVYLFRQPLLDMRTWMGLPSDSLDLWRDAGIEQNQVLVVMALAMLGAVVVALVVRAYGHRSRLPAVAGLAFPITLVAAGAGIALSGLGRYASDLLYRVDVSVTVGQGSPILVLLGMVLITFGQVMFMMRVGIEDERSEDYVLTARGKGLTETEVRDRHVVRNALAPTLAGTFLAFPTVIAGMVIVELELDVQGLSWTFYRAIEFQDVPLVMGVLVVLGGLGLIFRLVTDVSIAYLDPRQRRGEM